MAEEDFLDEVVESYIQNQIVASEMDGHSAEQIDQSFQVGSFILCVRMLSQRGGGRLPEGGEWLRQLAAAAEASEAECRQLCSGFIRAGWMDAGYCLTARGRSLAALDGAE